MSEQIQETPEHGRGKLNRGGNYGNVFGAGRKKGRVREACLNGFEKGIPRLVSIATGELENASVNDSTTALNILAKYGLGEAKQVLPEEMIDALAQSLEEHDIPQDKIEPICVRLFELLKDE